ncbi:ThiF family adenylyltransferase [Aureivirga marina]|uniref:ThiF family adenylyltransferase n=1 Tax=Aureivirga marina TaxID=1182451 RepID=UPI0018C99E0F|nr:ThiF family adenylyltransferase [Aureivirga marina]
MENRYSRNRLYISAQEQEVIKNVPIILGGAGIGSVIAECALRLGFENITIIDGDQVEESNINRQNYTFEDITKDKIKALENRLKSINENANIKVHNCFLTEENVELFILGHKIAINALDFTSDVPLLFDKICQKNEIPVLHPYNLGWGGLVTVICPTGLSLEVLEKETNKFTELDVVEYATGYSKFWGTPHAWIDEIVDKYKKENGSLPPPQLSIASWILAGICTHLLFNIATEKEYKKFPEFYLSTILNN